MNESADGRLVMHGLMRDALQKQDRRERPALFTRIHEFLFRRYDARAAVTEPKDITEDHERALLSAASHASLLETERYATWLAERSAVYTTARRSRVLETIYRHAVSRFPEESASAAASYNNVASSLDARGRSAEAEPLYRKALEIRERVLGPDHPDTAVVRGNLDEVIRRGQGNG
jgi:hypothetical protein